MGLGALWCLRSLPHCSRAAARKAPWPLPGAPAPQTPQGGTGCFSTRCCCCCWVVRCLSTNRIARQFPSQLLTRLQPAGFMTCSGSIAKFFCLSRHGARSCPDPNGGARERAGGFNPAHRAGFEAPRGMGATGPRGNFFPGTNSSCGWSGPVGVPGGAEDPFPLAMVLTWSLTPYFSPKTKQAKLCPPPALPLAVTSSLALEKQANIPTA